MAEYLIINCLVLAGALTGVWRYRFWRQKAWWLALLGVCILTAIFDNVIIGLMIVGYDPARILGVSIGRVPIEDFFYAIVAMLIMPALWKGKKS